MQSLDKSILKYLLLTKPDAVANISGGESYPHIAGVVEFYSLPAGVIVIADIDNLPNTETNIFAMHIHEGDSCEDDFNLTKGHYNPQNRPHPNHAGDLPPLFAFSGSAFLVTFSARFTVKEILGRTVVIHSNPDDFTTQPAGNSGTKIACGKIVKY